MRKKNKRKNVAILLQKQQGVLLLLYTKSFNFLDFKLAMVTRNVLKTGKRKRRQSLNKDLTDKQLILNIKLFQFCDPGSIRDWFLKI